MLQIAQYNWYKFTMTQELLHANGALEKPIKKATKERQFKGMSLAERKLARRPPVSRFRNRDSRCLPRCHRVLDLFDAVWPQFTRRRLRRRARGRVGVDDPLPGRWP